MKIYLYEKLINCKKPNNHGVRFAVNLLYCVSGSDGQQV